MLVEKLKESQIIKDLELLEEVEGRCEYCGEGKEISVSLQEIKCSNISCRGKVKEESKKVLKAMGVECEKVDEQLEKLLDEGLRSGLGVLKAMPRLLKGQPKEKVEGVKKEYKKLLNTALGYVVGLMEVEGLYGIESKLFKGVETKEELEEMYKEYKESKERYISKKLGLSEGEELKEVYDIIAELDRLEEEIKSAMKYTKKDKEKEEVEKIKIVCVLEVEAKKYQGDKRVELLTTMPSEEESEGVYVVVKEHTKKLLTKHQERRGMGYSYKYITEEELEEKLKELK